MKEHKTNFITGNTVYIYREFYLGFQFYLEISKEIDNQAKQKNGKIIFNINGGNCDDRILEGFLGLINYAKEEGVIVETIVEQMAYSCGSLIAFSGSVGHRYISRNAEYRYYPVSVETMLSYGREYDHIGTAMRGYITEHLYRDMENIRDNNFYIPAKECIKYGLANKIL